MNIEKTLLVLIVSFCMSTNASLGDDFILLDYGKIHLSQNRIEILEIPWEKVIAASEVIGKNDGNFDVNILISSAKKCIEKSKNIHFSKEMHWLYEKKEEGASDPFRSDPAPLLSDLEWKLQEATMREIDMGRSRNTCAAWKSEMSGRVWWEVKMCGLKKDGSSVGIVTVFLFQDMSAIEPKLVKINNDEQKMIQGSENK